jgi:hypothetical protein
MDMQYELQKYSNTSKIIRSSTTARSTSGIRFLYAHLQRFIVRAVHSSFDEGLESLTDVQKIKSLLIQSCSRLS